MSSVSDNVLRWLYNSLRAEYRDVDRTYSDVAQVLTRYSSLLPRTEVYTSENGASALLLVLQGTLPVQFRGTTYRFPLAVWIPHGYPKEPPIIIVIPTQEMSIRPGQYVSMEGRVYHPYLAHWNNSSLIEFLATLSDVFSKEPPVIARRPQIQGQSPVPPPIPTHPNGLRQPTYPREIPQSLQYRAPIPPPKLTTSTPSEGPPQRQDNLRPSSGAPPLPPKPGQPVGIRASEPGQGLAPYGRPTERGPPLPPLPHDNRRLERDQGFPQRSSSIQEGLSYRTDPRQQQHPSFNMNPQQPLGQYQQMPPLPKSPYYQQPQPQQHYQPQQQQQHYTPAPLQPLPPQLKQPLPDLLSSPLETNPHNPLSPPGSSSALSAPPIPLNPEKDRLLSLIASTLQPLLHRSISQNASAVPALQAQQAALQSFHHSLTTELTALHSLSATLSANESILHAAMHSAEDVERGLVRRELPSVDEVLVAPTVVGEQLYGLVAEEKAIGDALFVLGRALNGGRVGGEVFVRVTRGLAREQFLKKALVRKIARGMGLEGEGAP